MERLSHTHGIMLYEFTFSDAAKINLKKSIGKVTAYQLQELVIASIITLSALEQVIQKLLIHIPRYQKRIENQLKMVT
jgi:hypothetical protein